MRSSKIRVIFIISVNKKALRVDFNQLFEENNSHDKKENIIKETPTFLSA